MKTLRVLIVEDNAVDAELILRQLTRAGLKLEVTRVDQRSTFLEQLALEPDIILSDYSLPQFSGLEALQLLRDSGLQIPLILISGTVGEEVAVEAMRGGATDYLLKDRIARLYSAVERALREKEWQAERRRAEQQLQAQLGELKRWQAVTLDREDRVLALKREVNELLEAAGQAPRYTSIAPARAPRTP